MIARGRQLARSCCRCTFFLLLSQPDVLPALPAAAAVPPAAAGRLEEQKGVDILLAALKQLPAGAPVQAKGKIATVLLTKNQKEICKHFNDPRGCPGPACKRGKVHCCDVELLATPGKGCEKKHKRSEHDEAAHGAAKRRPN
jgi:hypothetical protein